MNLVIFSIQDFEDFSVGQHGDLPPSGRNLDGNRVRKATERL